MKQKIRVKVNGVEYEREVPTGRLLLDFLRYDLGLTGSKEGCSVGVCGACTVLMDGKMISSCLAPVVFADGHQITTVEGLAEDGRLHPVQQAFIDYGGFQCGICAPGPRASPGPSPAVSRKEGLMYFGKEFRSGLGKGKRESIPAQQCRSTQSG